MAHFMKAEGINAYNSITCLIGMSMLKINSDVSELRRKAPRSCN